MEPSTRPMPRIGVVRVHLEPPPKMDAMLGASRTTCSISAPTSRGPSATQGRASARARKPGRAAGTRYRQAQRATEPADVVCFAWRNTGCPPTCICPPHLPPSGTDHGGTRGKPDEPVSDAAIQYMNRLSDFLFRGKPRGETTAQATCSGSPARTAKNGRLRSPFFAPRALTGVGRRSRFRAEAGESLKIQAKDDS